jgi:DNA-binding transcriptional MerR regulator
MSPGSQSGTEMRIGDAARAIGLSAATLRAWEKQGLLAPRRSPSGQRVYGPVDLQVLGRIRHLRDAEGLHPRAIAHMLANEAGSRTQKRATHGDDKYALGRRLRTRRHRAALTLKQVAAGTGLSVSFISSIERGMTGLSLSTLQKLTSTYGITIADLMNVSPRARRLVKAGERPQLVTELGGMVVEQLALGERQMEVQLATFDSGVASDGAYSHEGEEFIFVLAGQFEVWIGETEHYVIEVGDCLYFPSTSPHRWRVSGREKAKLIWVETPHSL